MWGTGLVARLPRPLTARCQGAKAVLKDSPLTCVYEQALDLFGQKQDNRLDSPVLN